MFAGIFYAKHEIPLLEFISTFEPQNFREISAKIYQYGDNYDRNQEEAWTSVLPCHISCLSGKDKKRISTGISVKNSELTSNGKKIKEPTKARFVEMKRRELQDKLDALSIELIGQDVDAAYICSRLTSTHDSIDFFAFAEEWLEHTYIMGKKNYVTMLNTFEKYLG